MKTERSKLPELCADSTRIQATSDKGKFTATILARCICGFVYIYIFVIPYLHVQISVSFFVIHYYHVHQYNEIIYDQFMC